MGATPTSLGEYRMRPRDVMALGILVLIGTVYFLLDLKGYGTIAPR